MLTEA
jgi:amidohydrolase